MVGTKTDALRIVFSAVRVYTDNLLGRSLLFVCKRKSDGEIYYFEASFDASNFKHLTGFVSSISPGHFYDMCMDRRLSEKDFEFDPNGTTPLKLAVLPRIVRKDLSARMIGDFNKSMPKLFTEKIAGGVSGCIGFIKTGNSGRYVPNTLLNEDIRRVTTDADKVLLIYRKYRKDPFYSERVYSAKDVDWSTMHLQGCFSYLELPH
jgi:hypothetical protein